MLGELEGPLLRVLQRMSLDGFFRSSANAPGRALGDRRSPTPIFDGEMGVFNHDKPRPPLFMFINLGVITTSPIY